MQSYERNKLKTAWEITHQIENWPAAFDLRIRRHQRGLRLLRFRRGLNVVCRGGDTDWTVIHELLFAGSYARAMDSLKKTSGRPVVLDLGGNIGLFSLLAASTHPEAQVHAYEPGPPNFRLFEMNRLANPSLTGRIELHKEAVGGSNRTMEWYFDEANPGGSSLFGNSGSKYKVQIRAFKDVVNSIEGTIRLLKMDIEGAEYEVLSSTPDEVWKRVESISLELHDDPERKISQTDFLDRMKQLGFKIVEEAVCSFFLHR